MIESRKLEPGAYAASLDIGLQAIADRVNRRRRYFDAREVARARIERLDFGRNRALGLLFVHVPKCGGSSVEAQLGIDHGHRSAVYFRAADPALFARAWKFSIVRNPYDRLVSAFHYLKNHTRSERDRAWAAEALGEAADFAGFVRRLAEPGLQRPGARLAALPAAMVLPLRRPGPAPFVDEVARTRGRSTPSSPRSGGAPPSACGTRCTAPRRGGPGRTTTRPGRRRRWPRSTGRTSAPSATRNSRRALTVPAGRRCPPPAGYGKGTGPERVRGSCMVRRTGADAVTAGAGAPARRAAGSAAAPPGEAPGEAPATRWELRLLAGFFVTLVIPGSFPVAGLTLSPPRIFLLLAFVPLFLHWFRGRAGRITVGDVGVLLYCFWIWVALFAVHGLGRVHSAGIQFVEIFGAYWSAGRWSAPPRTSSGPIFQYVIGWRCSACCPSR